MGSCIQALTDIPAAVFVDELAQTYPDAKVILTIRDPDKWLASMNSSVFAAARWSACRILKRLNIFTVGSPFKGPDLVV